MNGPIGEDTLWVEVSDERFAEPVQRSFKRVGAPRRVTAVDVDGAGHRPVRALELTADGEVTPGPAFACVVEDSGSGLAWLVYGGAAGLWIGDGEVLRVDDPAAIFDAYLLVGREALVLAEP